MSTTFVSRIKRALCDDRSFTRNLQREVESDMHTRYRSSFQLDDAFLCHQDFCDKTSHHDISSLPWSVIVAFAALGIALTLLLTIALTGEVNLG